MNLHIVNSLLPLVFLGYQILIDSVNLFPFNDVAVRDKRLRKYEVFGNYPPLIIIAWCFYHNSIASMWIGFVMATIILIMHLFAWWIPYLTGYPAAVKKDYERYFKRTFKFLPKISEHIIPDAEHVGVGILLVTIILFEGMAIF
jgi:steroid 5-alpha reductase family enzyme